ncbi:MAG: NAD-binding protein, partial [Clostridia bacterium]|nr:NAD-binding protein [Clostridia bacterium]
MDIIVVGCGKVGTSIAANLVAEGHNVTVVDKDADVIESITNVHDVYGINGNGTDIETLQDAGVGNCELLVATTGSDEFNMLACFLAKRLGVANTIARIRKPEYNDKSLNFIKDELEISMAINPE